VSERAPFAFFVGCGRSGTTLVRAIFNAHPHFCVPDESYFPLTFLQYRRRYEQQPFAIEAFLSDLAADGSFANWRVDIDAVRERLRASPPRSVPEAIRAVYATYAAAQGKERYGDKTPVFVRSMPRLAAAFPEARFVHIVRDGRNVALSRVAASWSSDLVHKEALVWRGVVAKGRHDGIRLGADRYRELRYEDLVDDPEVVVGDVCRFLDLEYDPAMIRYHEHAAALVAELPHPEEHSNLVVAPTRTRRWQDEMRPADVALFEAIAGRQLDAFGYETSEPISLRARVEGAGRVARWRYRRSLRDGKSAVSRRMHRR
jgi:Sulfotransferase family